MLAYFGVFVVAPFTVLVVVLVGAALLVGTVVALLGAGGPLGVRLAGALALVGAAIVRRAQSAAVARWWRPRVLRLGGSAGRAGLAAMGPKAAGLEALHRAGLPILPGFVVTEVARARPLSPRELGRWLRGLGAERVIVRSSFVGEDGDRTSGAGRFLSVRDVVATPALVAAAIDRVFRSAPGAGGGVIVQPMADASALGVIATVDPRTGFRERALCQRFDLDADGVEVGVTTLVVDRAVGGAHEGLALLDRFARGRAIEAEVAYTAAGVVFLQLRPLLGVPAVETFVGGGLVAFPATALSPLSRARYVGAFGIAARLREVLGPVGLAGPADADVIERFGRFFLRWGAVGAVERPARLALVLLRPPRAPKATSGYDEAVVRGAQAALVASWFISLAERLGPVEAAVRRALEAGVQPEGRPSSPEELADPGYAVAFPVWSPPPLPALRVDGPWLRRLLMTACLRRYRAWLLSRFQWRERVLTLNREARAACGGVYGTPDELEAWREAARAVVPSVLHVSADGVVSEPPEGPERGGNYGPAVSGLARGSLAFDGESCPNGAVLWVPDARSLHAVWFPKLAGLIVDRAGPLSHLVLLAREAGLPTVLGPRPAISEGRVVTLDGATGRLHAEDEVGA